MDSPRAAISFPRLFRLSWKLCSVQKSNSMDIYDSYQNFYTYHWPTLTFGNLEKSKEIQEKSKKIISLNFFLDISWIFSVQRLERVSRQLCSGQESNSIDIYDSYQNFYTLNWPALSLGNLEKSKKIQEKIQENNFLGFFLGFFLDFSRFPKLRADQFKV